MRSYNVCFIYYIYKRATVSERTQMRVHLQFNVNNVQTTSGCVPRCVYMNYLLLYSNSINVYACVLCVHVAYYTRFSVLVHFMVY